MIKPYGTEKLENRYITEQQLIDVMATDFYPSLECDEYVIMECQRIADGSLSPIRGFCTKSEMDLMIDESKLASGIYFPLPIYLQKKVDVDIGGNSRLIILKDQRGKAFGYINNPEVYSYDLVRLSKFIFDTDDMRHPGVKRLFDNGNGFVGGEINVLRMENDLSQYCMSPSESREMIRKMGWKTCVGFQTRNVPHLAHEYLQKCCMEIFDGVLIHPVVGWKKTGDYQPNVVLDAYNYLIRNIYPESKALLSGLQIQMRYAGPKEAAIHAIIRQNYGCTHFIVGRDHAGVGSFYNTYEAHQKIEEVQDYLDIKVLKMKGPFYCKKCENIVTDNICAHDEKYHEDVSGTIIRKKILAGKYPPKEYIRNEIVDEILKHKNIFVE